MSQMEEKLAVECGYWHLWSYNPDNIEEGKNPFKLDSRKPKWELFKDFLKREVRYSSLYKQFPNEAEELAEASLTAAKYRYQSYLRMESIDWSATEEE